MTKITAVLMVPPLRGHATQSHKSWVMATPQSGVIAMAPGVPRHRTQLGSWPTHIRCTGRPPGAFYSRIGDTCCPVDLPARIILGRDKRDVGTLNLAGTSHPHAPRRAQAMGARPQVVTATSLDQDSRRCAQSDTAFVTRLGRGIESRPVPHAPCLQERPYGRSCAFPAPVA